MLVPINNLKESIAMESRKQFENRLVDHYLKINSRDLKELTADGLPELPALSEAEVQELEKDVAVHGLGLKVAADGTIPSL